MMMIGMMHDKVIANLSSLINTFVTFFLFLMFLFFSCLCVVSQTSPTKLNVHMKWHAQCSRLIHHSLCLHEATPTHMTHPFTVTDRLVTLHQCKPSSPSLSCHHWLYRHHHYLSDPHTPRIPAVLRVEDPCRIHRPSRPCYLDVLLCELQLLTLRTLDFKPSRLKW